MNFLQQCLSVFSDALLLPALGGVLFLAAWTASLIGGLIREWLQRGEVRRSLRETRWLLAEGSASADVVMMRLQQCRCGLPGRLAEHLREWPGERERDKCLEDLELEVAARLAQLTWLTRVAPMLGLMGTLIPMGPALTGLASGNLGTLASNLVVAFTATVAGVFVGCAAFSVNVIRKNWYNRDLSDLEHIFNGLRERYAVGDTGTRSTLPTSAPNSKREAADEVLCVSEQSAQIGDVR